MKKILLIFTVLLAAVSCLDKSVYTQSGTIIATFEYTGMTDTDSLYFDDNFKIGIGWDMLAFYHNVDKETSEFKGGFLLSWLSVPKSKNTEGLANNEYRVNTEGANTYVVFHQTADMPEHDMGFTFVPSAGSSGTCTMQSCYVNNTVAVAEAVKKSFGLGDKLLLKATGYLAGTQTGTANIVLAENTDSLMSHWTSFDLSKLGAIDKVDFELVGVPEGVPATVCMDNVMTSVSLTY